MILDSSAVVAILLREPGHEHLLERLAEAAHAGIGAPTLTESGMVMTARMGIGGATLTARLTQEVPLEVIPFSEQHARLAIDAFFRFGKGRHPARLNFGDCMAYAVASLAGAPLLCVGEEFAKTDLSLAA